MDFAPCPKCGAFNAPDAAACVECRSPLDAEPDATTPLLTLKPEPVAPEEPVEPAPPEPTAPAPPAAQVARPPRPTASTPQVMRPPRPAPPPPPRSPRLPLGRAIALAAALVAIAVGVKLFVFPSTKQLVAGDFRAYAPAWSPTGKHIAFLIEDKVGAHLAVFDFAKGDHVMVGDVPAPDPDGFSWSPDGKRLAYVGPGGENEWMGAIRVFDVASGQSRALAPGSAPRWRADGSLLAVCGPEMVASFDSDSEDEYNRAPAYDMQNRFCRIDAASGTITRTALAADHGMALSPMLDRVVFERYTEVAMAGEVAAAAGGDAEFQAMADTIVAGKAQNVVEGNRDLNRALEARQKKEKRRSARGVSRVPDVELFAADLDRGEPVRLSAPGEAAFPSWTPAGDRILYAANGASGIEFWTMREDGGDRQPLLEGVKVADPSSVTLSPDGKSVFFVAPVEGDPGLAKLMTGEEPADLHVAPVGGGAARRLSNKHTFKHRFAVSPDGKRIAYEVLQDVKMLSGEAKSEIWLMNR